MLRHGESLVGLEVRDLGAGGEDELVVGVGVAAQAPAAGCGFGEQDPGPVGEAGVAGGGGDDPGEFLDDGQLLVPVEGAGVGEDLDSDVGAVAVDVGQAVDG